MSKAYSTNDKNDKLKRFCNQ